MISPEPNFNEEMHAALPLAVLHSVDEVPEKDEPAVLMTPLFVLFAEST